MRITCPYCGERDRREFTYQGDAVILSRPSEDADPQEWSDYLHIRDNHAGPTRDLWYHDPCGAWIKVDRDTTTHEILASAAVKETKP